jgi:hypothetical protein
MSMPRVSITCARLRAILAASHRQKLP